MKLWEYKDYEEYVQAQIDGIYKHPSVKDNVNYEWVQKEEIPFIYNKIIIPHFNKLGIIPKFGICHGAKLGKENMWFEKITGIDFIGTDLVIKSNKEMKLINWDFNKENELWKNKFDILYSNAFDHSDNPSNTLEVWKKTMKDTSICILEYSQNDTQCTSTDPFAATIPEYLSLFNNCNLELISIDKFYSNREKYFLTFKMKD